MRFDDGDHFIGHVRRTTYFVAGTEVSAAESLLRGVCCGGVLLPPQIVHERGLNVVSKGALGPLPDHARLPIVLRPGDELVLLREQARLLRGAYLDLRLGGRCPADRRASAPWASSSRPSFPSARTSAPCSIRHVRSASPRAQ